MSKYAPKREDGMMAYVITKRSPWDHANGRKPHERIEWAESLSEAKRQYGWTREMHTTVHVRRATPEDLVS